MPNLHPGVRIAALALLLGAAFLAQRAIAVCVPYGVILLLLGLAGLLRKHAAFLLFAMTPLFIALFGVWGVVLGHGPGGEAGFTYALTTGLRVAALGGLFQWFLLPLFARPASLRDFLYRIRAPASFAALLVAPVVFLPEVQRRISRVVDARKAQGRRVRGLAGLVMLPQMLTPVVASLLESAMVRAELWDHRGYLVTAYRPGAKPAPLATSVGVIASAIAALLGCVLMAHLWT